MKTKISLFITLLSCISLISQIIQPSLSPTITTKQKVGLANINLQYGQPSVKGRTIFGSLIPYNRVWRTGANASTKFTTDKEINLAGLNLPAGTYGLYSIPGEKEWTVIFNKKSNLWGSAGYNKENDIIRFKIPVTSSKELRETFSIYFENFTINGASMVIAWENTIIKVPVLVNSDRIIEEQIASKITNEKGEIKAQTYFDAAQYYYQKNKDLKQALIWFTKAEELRPQAFWYTYYKSELALKLNKKDIAKTGAQKCLKAAKNSKSSDYGYIAKCSLLLKAIDN
ncbi:DUF2911 domain-containing protein [uncultured Tenacibaculum sp.]|uniref:DUF2911 domain-containing protein n=1 Tax=uncultured Tenacibaculum sp. TaxID=174713 RepID=UPI00261489EB|nr:DUF2911 domain-containing protein [uncultured Tenacibaculum sp.]